MELRSGPALLQNWFANRRLIVGGDERDAYTRRNGIDDIPRVLAGIEGMLGVPRRSTHNVTQRKWIVHGPASLTVCSASLLMSLRGPQKSSPLIGSSFSQQFHHGCVGERRL